MRDYNRLINNISSNYNPELSMVVESRMFTDLAGIERNVAKFVKLAMSAVDDSYTQRSKQAGNNAKDWLKAEQHNVDYAFQGSVMTNTHIKGYSDIDLLTLCTKFYGSEIAKVRNILQYSNNCTWNEENQLRKFEQSFVPYTGDSLQDLKELRLENERILSKHYEMCDTSKAKAIRIKNQNLNMEVDVVTANKHKSIQYILKGYDDKYLGVRIYDKEKNCQLDIDFPFLRIQLMNNRGIETFDRFKKMIRFLKNVRSQADKKIDLTSFEINSICYDIPTWKYSDAYYLQLVNVVFEKIYSICNNQTEADNLRSVDGTEYVFRNKPDKVRHLRLLMSEVKNIIDDLQSSNKRIIY